jgi:hypothetical protein
MYIAATETSTSTIKWPDRMCSYTVKNKELKQEGWGVVYVCGGCAEDDFIEQAFLAHKVASRKQIYVGKVPVKPSNVAKKIVEFRARNLRFLEMHPAQYMRLMCNSGHYVLAPEMATGGALTEAMHGTDIPVMLLNLRACFC